jgi:Na+/H+ antiporter
MPDVRLVVAGLLAVTILAALAERVRVPAAVVLLVAGLGIGFVPGTPDVRLDPDVIFLVFLPPILYVAAFRFASEDIRGNVRPIATLALGLVAVTVAGVAAVAHLVIGVSWAAAFVLGAIVAPTDPVAATATIRRLGAPDRTATILEGESLVNDGTGLTAFKLAVGAAGLSGFSAGGAALRFAWTLLAGAAIGAAAGWLASQARRRLDQPRIEATFALATTYGAFFVADELGVSGILGSVLAGLVVGRRSADVGSPDARLQSYGFWETVVFIAESLLFLLLGLGFQQVVADLGKSTSEVGGEAALVVATVFAFRAAWFFLVPHLLDLVTRRWEREFDSLSHGELATLSVGGMRGAVTVAAALSVPVAAGGHPFPDRALVIFLGYATVVGTLILPTLGLPPLLRRLGLAEGKASRRIELEARLHVTHAALERAEQLAREDELPELALRRAREAYEMRIARQEAEFDGDSSDEREVGAAYREIRRQLVLAERAALGELRARRAAPGAVLRRIERELDLEQARLAP